MMFNACNPEYADLEGSDYDILANFEYIVHSLDRAINKRE